MKRVVIIGGGVSGLICSYAFRQHRDLDIQVLEARSIGGEFLVGGLKYIHRTDDMVRMFNELDVIFSNYAIRGGILLRGEVLPYPNCLQSMDKDNAARIQADHYRKTRRTEGGKLAKTAMNDPASTQPRKALRCHFPDMIKQLAIRTKVASATATKIEKDHVVIKGDKRIPYDYLVLTIPLWAIKECVDFYVPHGLAMKLNLATVSPRRDRYAKWDYVYMPYTPDDAVHRISPLGGGYSVEVNGDLDQLKLTSDLNFIFPEGWALERIRQGLKGHLLPLEQQPEWPENIAPLGRFAKWDARATADVTLDDAVALARRWFE